MRFSLLGPGLVLCLLVTAGCGGGGGGTGDAGPGLDSGPGEDSAVMDGGGDDATASDSGGDDGGGVDSGGDDGGGADAAGTDGGGTDAAGTDGGGTDAGGPDAGGPDAGTDACIPPPCPAPPPGCHYEPGEPCTCGILVCDMDCGDGLTCGATEYCHYAIPYSCGGRGSCMRRPEACPDIYRPVCGCDGADYGNDCEAHAAGTDVMSEGMCGMADCRTEGCPDGFTCMLCWTAWACLPDGAIC